MSKHIINAGATSQRFYIYLQDSTTGQGETGVTAMTCYYLRDAVSGTTPAAVTLTVGAVIATTGTTYPTWTSGQVREIGYMPGIYLVDLPDAIFAASARNAVVQIIPTTGTPWLPVNLEFTLAGVNIYDSVRMGMTALPNVTAGALGGVPLSVNASGGVNTVQLGGTAQTGRDIGASVLLSSGTGTGQVNLSTGRVGINWGDVINPTTALALTGTTISTAQVVASVTGNVGGNVTGSVGSVTGNVGGNVTGSVGSVTGNVGGNVTGSVGSVSDPASIWNRLTSSITTAGSIGKLLVDNVNATISSRSTLTAADVWNALTSGFVTVGSIGKLLVDNINATISSRSTLTATDVWTHGTRILTAGTNIVLAKGTGVTGFTDIDATGVENAVWNAATASHTLNNTYGERVLRAATTQATVAVTGSNHVAADIHELQPAVIDNTHFAAGAIDSNALAASAASEIAAAQWSTDPSLYPSGTAGYWQYQAGVNSQSIISDTNYMTSASYAESLADALLARNIAGGSNAGRLVKQALFALRNKSEIVGTTLNVYNETDGLISWTATVSSSASANPVTGIDP